MIRLHKSNERVQVLPDAVVLDSLGHLQHIGIECLDFFEGLALVVGHVHIDDVCFVPLVDLLHHVQPEVLQREGVGDQLHEDVEFVRRHAGAVLGLGLALAEGYLADGVEVELGDMVSHA